MITIYQPKLEVRTEDLILSCSFKVKGNLETLWYSLPKEMQRFSVIERSDAFLVGLLFLGLKLGEDIHVKGKLSARLNYTLNHYLINALCLANSDFRPIKVTADTLSTENLNIEETAGTGMSCGVDSFATFYDHDKTHAPYKIEYFTFFNVGSHGDNGGNTARDIFNLRFKRINDFADKVNVKAIKIDSNLSEILQLNFQKTHSLRSISCVLLLQKLFSNFYYASSIRYDHFKFDKVRIAEYDLLNLQMLSTESTQFFSSVTQYNRTERIELLSLKADSYSFLDVCVNPRNSGEIINCSRCHKCIRTMLTLDHLNVLDNYSKVFYLESYYKNKNKYVGQILFSRKKETLDYELFELIRTKKIPLISYGFGLKYFLQDVKTLFKKQIKSILKSA